MALIILDAGHSDQDPGASSNGLVEADLTLKIANLVMENLAGYDVGVGLAPRGTLSERAAFANDAGADYFCSIHVNAAGGTGFESYIYTGAPMATRALAIVLHNQVMDYLDGYGVNDRGLKEANFAVLRETNCPAILLECLFIDNENDAMLLHDESFLDGLANEIAFALSRVLDLRAKQAQVVTNTPIAGRSKASIEQAREWAKSRAATPDFIALADLYWQLAPGIGVRADVAYAQAAKETGFGRFGGVIDRSYNNWCGLKTGSGGDNDDPGAHMRFDSDRTGVLAHLQHLAAYAGITVTGDIVDPRYSLVVKGIASSVELLGGKWAPADDYGDSIVKDYLAGMVVMELPEDWETKYYKEYDINQRLKQQLKQAHGILAGALYLSD